MRSGRSFMLRSFSYQLMNDSATVKINEAVDKKILKASKIRFVVQS